MAFLNSIATFFAGIMMTVSSLFGHQQPTLGASVTALPQVLANYQDSLASPIGATDTTMTLVSGKDTLGRNLSGYFCFTIDGQTSISEFVCGTVSGTAVTAMTRGIDPLNPNVGGTALEFAHRRGASVQITDYTSLGSITRMLNGVDTIPGTLVYTTSPSFTLPTQIIDKSYADGLAIAGAPNASTSVQGLLQLPTQAQTDAKTATGSTGAALCVTPNTLRSTLLNDYVADTGTANTYAITPSPAITSYKSGEIFSFTAGNSNSGASTLNVNGLGAKAITKNYNVALVTGDIVAGQMVVVEYDGTQFELISQKGTDPNTVYQTLSNLSTDGTMASNSTTLYPSQSAVVSYVTSKTALPVTVTTDYETAARFTATASTGSNTFGARGLAQTSGSTSGHAYVQWFPTGAGSTDSLITGSPSYSSTFNLTAIGTTGTVFTGIGYNPTGAFTTVHIGFKILFTTGPVATLYATQADGTTENVSSALTTLLTTDNVDVRFQMVGTSSVNYYWRKNGGAWSAATNLTSNIPTTGNLASFNFIQNYTDNNSSSTTNTIDWLSESYTR